MLEPELNYNFLFIAFFLLGAIFGVALNQTIVMIKEKVKRRD